ncbi:ATP-binding protein [Actinomadura viridis]|uniref:ATP-binding protein n=1 Tax=Actinomadura viridis TaxID=58110 RepID=UPI0036A9AA1C
MGEVGQCEIVIKRQLEAVAEVRRFVRLTLGPWGMDAYIPCLVASELVANAIQYAATEQDVITLRMSRADDGALWLEVQDPSCAIPSVPEVNLTSESGRGLFVVQALTRHWGVRPLAAGAGKVIFAILDP